MDYLEIIGTIIGVIYLILEYRANKLLWIAGFIMPAIYVVVYFRAGLYADFGINVYYLIASVYGMLVWHHGAKNDAGEQAELPIVNTPRSNIIPLVAVFAATFVVIAFILDRFTDSDVVIADSFTTALSIVVLRKPVVIGKYCLRFLTSTSALFSLIADRLLPRPCRGCPPGQSPGWSHPPR